MPIKKSLLADDDDEETLTHSTPSDVDTAITYLTTTFPYQPPNPTYLEPPTLLLSQLYALVPGDRTAVDREVDRRRRAGSVRVMRCVALGVDEYVVMGVKDYVAVVRSMWALAGVTGSSGGAAAGGGEKVATSEDRKEEAGAATASTTSLSSLLAPNTQPIRRKRPRTETNPTPSRPPLSPSARQPVALPLHRPSTAPVFTSTLLPTAPVSEARTASSSSASASPDEDKENALSARRVIPKMPSTPPPRIATAPPSSPSPRAADQQLLLDTLINTFLPNYTDVTITRGELLALLYDNLPYQQLTADDLLSTLFHHQLIAHNHPTTSSYLLLLPHTAHLIRECLEARRYIVRLIEKSRFKQLRKSELEGRVRLPVSERGVVWHVLEMVGSGRLVEVETTKGTVVRVNSEYKDRVRR